ncbi:DMT family transporter [Qingshengfaniella alkalisoli]|uniref:DMT family transporter n=1 Tax=Qingshengfaniella alkalisoli TaxID=2599296 RepID=A0A5B8IVP2_9RHOB|nr:DMT family transporter [Qingshengfaniella alkalisoli]QDY68941.1 DMT family transporter [Qingshengfaniella alkalisoli]
MTSTNDLRGIILMLVSMAAFAVEDMFVKSVTDRLPIGEALFILGLGGALIFGIWSKRQGVPLFTSALLDRAVMVRNLSEMLGTLFFVTAITVSPLSTASAVLQATPLVVTMGAALFLGETVGWRRWSAIMVGFLGVLMIVRPGTEGFEATSLFAVGGVIFLSSRDLATRATPENVTSIQLSAYAFAIVSLAGLALMLVQGGIVRPTGIESLQLTGALCVGVGGYYCITQAMRIGTISVVAPFRYSRLVFALIIGIVVFNERPDLWTLLGSLVIIGSGLYTFARERRVRRLAGAASPTPG